MKHPLVFPMAFYVFYIWCLAVVMFRSRVRAIKVGEVSPKYFKTFTGANPAERTVLIGRHYDNQFQVPILFLITCVLFISMNAANTATLVLAWLFIASRLVHSWIHLGNNSLQKRVAAFAAGWLILLLLWVQLICF